MIDVEGNMLPHISREKLIVSMVHGICSNINKKITAIWQK